MLIVVPSRVAAARWADGALSGAAPPAGLRSSALWTDGVLTLRDLVATASAAVPDARPRIGRAAAAVLAAEVVERLEPEVRALFGPGVEGPGAARAIGAALAEIR
ncbi:MAG TPA: hypothetical protein VM778_11100, partial [Gemmatimonadota bacterium]|nr:hypothetical protein [Gemmatimonadota bacterium]